MPPPPPQQRNELLDWYNSIPPITKALVTLSLATTTLSGLGLVQPSTFILYWPNIKYKLQLWRLVSCFFFNRFSLGYAFNLYFLYRNSQQLETEVFRNQPADYMYFHLFTSALQLVVAHIFGLYVLSDGLLLSIAYLWAQHNRDTIVSFMFGIRFKAIYLPWAMVATDFLMTGGIPKASIAGILSAHIYHYLKTIYPRQSGRQYLRTPAFLQRLFPPTIRASATPTSGGFRGGFERQNQSNNSNLFGRHSWGTGRRLGS